MYSQRDIDAMVASISSDKHDMFTTVYEKSLIKHVESGRAALRDDNLDHMMHVLHDLKSLTKTAHAAAIGAKIEAVERDLATVALADVQQTVVDIFSAVDCMIDAFAARNQSKS